MTEVYVVPSVAEEIEAWRAGRWGRFLRHVDAWVTAVRAGDMERQGQEAKSLLAKTLANNATYAGLTVNQFGIRSKGGAPRLWWVRLDNGDILFIHSLVKTTMGPAFGAQKLMAQRTRQLRAKGPKALKPQLYSLPGKTTPAAPQVARVPVETVHWPQPKDFPSQRHWVFAVLDTKPDMTGQQLEALGIKLGTWRGATTDVQARKFLLAWRRARGYTTPLPRGNPKWSAAPEGGWPANWQAPQARKVFDPHNQLWPVRGRFPSDDAWLVGLLDTDPSLNISQLLRFMEINRVLPERNEAGKVEWLWAIIQRWRLKKGYGTFVGASELIQRLPPYDRPANWLPVDLEPLREIVEPKPYGARNWHGFRLFAI